MFIQSAHAQQPSNDRSYMALDHVADEKYHHASVNLILGAPLPPAGNGLANVAPNVKARHQHEHQNQFGD